MPDVILTHQNADFDAIASMLGAYKLYPHAIPILPSRINRNVEQFLTLYRSALPFKVVDDVSLQNIGQIILTDTQTSPIINTIQKKQTQPVQTLIIEHHDLKRDLHPHETWHYEKLGAITTWFVEQIRDRDIHLTPLEATLLALGIYEDNGMLTYGATTPRDVDAVAWLLRHGAALDTIRRFLSHPLNDQQQELFEQLLNHTNNQTIQGYNVTIASATLPEVISGINSVTGQLRDILDPTALIVLVKMPHAIQLVARSRHDAVDVGAIATYFKGGGHARAAAATIYKQTLEDVQQTLWRQLHLNIMPSVRVADLMSYGAQTVRDNARIQDIIQHIRRIGHEGYPVLNQDGYTVGLLTMRDADRALEHGLNTMRVGEVMRAGEVTLSPHDSVYHLEQTMVKSGWGQIPVVDENRHIIGIITRTDLINHWASTHPQDAQTPDDYQPIHIADVLGEDVQRLTDTIAQHARNQRLSLYLVGGIVRDLLLKRPNYDIDFVVEGDAINFAQSLCHTYGGKIHSYQPFGTAKWQIDQATARQLGLATAQLPDHIDFATARSELYTHPTALPTVYHSGIKLDLRRRDFTMNTLAIQLSPQAHHQHLHDYYGGINDIHARLIRVLHSLSFVDDPTRILRAVRFSERLHFSIETRTQQLILAGLPMLGRITGERVRNELSLLLQEENALRGLQKLHALGVLKAIHPALTLTDQTIQIWQQYHANDAPHIHDKTLDRWTLLLVAIPYDDIIPICRRLLWGQRDMERFQQTAYLLQKAPYLHQANSKPSTITLELDKLDSHAWRMALRLATNPLVRNRLQQYASQWRDLRPYTNGHTLKALGLPASPAYRTILARLRQAWLDGEIASQEQEANLLKTLLSSE